MLCVSAYSLIEKNDNGYALNCFNVHLREDDIAGIDELYVPHPITCNR